MQENARFILGLREAGWSEKEINDFMLFIETGEEQFKPKSKPTSAEKGTKEKKTGKSAKQ